MRRDIHFTELGATLFVPATHKNMLSIISGVKYPNLKSVVIDFEDGLSQDDFDSAFYSTSGEVEPDYTRSISPEAELKVFIRPRNPQNLKELLRSKNIQNIDGFILPKFSLDNASEYLSVLHDAKHYIMPSIEGKELFNTNSLVELKETLEPFRERIILVRFGLQDMLRQLSMKRDAKDSIFDYAVTNTILGNFLAIFKSDGYAVSGGVYPYFNDAKGFMDDTARDLKEGLFSKTIIHPSQIDLLDEVYKVTSQELDDAKEILKTSLSIININGSMGEAKTMSPYAQLIIKRAEIYGIM